MLGNIKLQHYEKCYPKRLKKFFQSDLSYQNYDLFVPNSKRAIVGNIPNEIISLFKVDKAHNIKQFQESLSDITRFLRAKYQVLKKEYGYDFSIYPPKILKEVESDASLILNRRLENLDWAKHINAEIKYEGHGAFANVYKLSLKDDSNNKIMHDKALKVFHDIQEPIGKFAKLHNNYAETNFWIFLKNAAGHDLGKTQFTKHYISDMKSGYYLTEFIDPKITKTTSPFHIEDILKLIFVDAHNNFPIGMKLYDGGGFKKTSKFTGDKVIIRYFKKLYYRSQKELPEVLARYETLAKNPKTPHHDKIQRAIDLFKKQKPINN